MTGGFRFSRIRKVGERFQRERLRFLSGQSSKQDRMLWDKGSYGSPGTVSGWGVIRSSCPEIRNFFIPLSFAVSGGLVADLYVLNAKDTVGIIELAGLSVAGWRVGWLGNDNCLGAGRKDCAGDAETNTKADALGEGFFPEVAGIGGGCGCNGKG